MTVQKLDLKTWANIFRNITELNKEGYESAYGDEWITPIYLDPMVEGDSKWGLAHDEELFEQGFETEEEAQERLNYLESQLIEWRDFGKIKFH